MKYYVLNRAFLCSFLQFCKFYPINFHFGGYFYSNRKMKIWFYPTDAILMGLNTQMPPKLSVALGLDWRTSFLGEIGITFYSDKPYLYKHRKKNNKKNSVF